MVDIFTTKDLGAKEKLNKQDTEQDEGD